MTGPNDPQYPDDREPYPQQPYPQQPYPQQPYPQPGYAPTPPAGPRPRWLERVHDRLVERPVPRLGISLAGVGVGLAVLGVIVWGATYISEGRSSGFAGGGGTGSRHFLGGVIALIVVAIGYTLLAAVRRGPLATAGIGATALGVPVAMEFLTYDPSSGTPINTDAVVWVSLIVYALSYLFVVGARGHTFYVGVGLLLLWSYILDKVAPSAAESLFRFIPGAGDLGSRTPDVSTVGGVSLVIGGAYYVIGWALDKVGRRGIAVAFVLIGFPAVAVGIIALADDLDQVGTGIAFLLVGIGLATYGARYQRRFTTWIWAVGAAVGGVLIVGKIVDSDSGPAVGISLIVLGAVFVAGGALLARALKESDDVATTQGEAA